jgi:uncharacterized protein (UPF0335 family)
MADDLDDIETAHTSDGKPRPNTPGVAGEHLKSVIDRIENIQCSIDEYKEDQKEVFAEAKSAGFDVKIIRKVLRIRRQRKEEREEELAMTELYLHALGML